MENDMHKKQLCKYANTVIAFAGAVALIMLLSGPLLPFTAAWIMALCLRPVINRLNTLTGLSRRFFGAALIIVSLSLMVLVLFRGVSALWTQGKAFLIYIWENWDSAITKARGILDKMADIIPALDGLVNVDAIVDILADCVKDILTSVSAYSASAAAAFASHLPSIILGIAVFIISSFYMSMDFDAVNAYLESLVPEKYKDSSARIKTAVSDILRRYVKAYFILFSITFSLLLFFLALMKSKYALIISFAAAAADMLPAVGVGIILVPWSVFMFASGSPSHGIWLLVTYAVVTVVRRIAEPHIIGSNFGIHPLGSLAAMYIGYRIWGVIGMFLGPAAACAVTRLIKHMKGHDRSHGKAPKNSG